MSPFRPTPTRMNQLNRKRNTFRTGDGKLALNLGQHSMTGVFIPHAQAEVSAIADLAAVGPTPCQSSLSKQDLRRTNEAETKVALKQLKHPPWPASLKVLELLLIPKHLTVYQPLAESHLLLFKEFLHDVLIHLGCKHTQSTSKQLTVDNSTNRMCLCCLV